MRSTRWQHHSIGGWLTTTSSRWRRTWSYGRSRRLQGWAYAAGPMEGCWWATWWWVTEWLLHKELLLTGGSCPTLLYCWPLDRCVVPICSRPCAAQCPCLTWSATTPFWMGHPGCYYFNFVYLIIVFYYYYWLILWPHQARSFETRLWKPVTSGNLLHSFIIII